MDDVICFVSHIMDKTVYCIAADKSGACLSISLEPDLETLHYHSLVAGHSSRHNKMASLFTNHTCEYHCINN